RSGTVAAEGDLDFRGTLGVAKDAPVGFAQIRLRFDLDTDAPQDKLDQLLKLTERYCVVYQTSAAARRLRSSWSGSDGLVLDRDRPVTAASVVSPPPARFARDLPPPGEVKSYMLTLPWRERVAHRKVRGVG
ncbi:MAG TPA: OsmC family protein, partial [Xanthobacteraceae bacterium]|nr:OsmC family protein [Xanthobacteraceae bacterium]